MNLLVSNDDGVFAEGIRALANTLAEAGHQVTVVCPDRERSATGHGLTMHQPIRAEQVEGVFQSTVRAWACSGTPADCVKLALGALLDQPPDLVLSGINQGSNLGTDILYSGTVSAAMEGTLEGIPSMALSLTSFSSRNFQPAAEFAKRLVNHFKTPSLPNPILLNINIPAVTTQQIQGIRITRQGIRRYYDQFEQRIDPRGKTYYWLAGEVLEDLEDPVAEQGWPESLITALQAFPTDVQAIQDRYISITPLQYNLTSQMGLSAVQTWLTESTFDNSD